MDPVVHVPDPELPAAVQQSTAGYEQSPALENSLADLRLHRIGDLQLDALAKPDALAANLQAANGGLLRIGYRLEQTIEAALEKFPNSLERFERLLPAIETHLKILRQVDRLAQLDQRIASVRQAGGPGKPR